MPGKIVEFLSPFPFSRVNNPEPLIENKDNGQEHQKVLRERHKECPVHRDKLGFRHRPQLVAGVEDSRGKVILPCPACSDDRRVFVRHHVFSTATKVPLKPVTILLSPNHRLLNLPVLLRTNTLA